MKYFYQKATTLGIVEKNVWIHSSGFRSASNLQKAAERRFNNLSLLQTAKTQGMSRYFTLLRRLILQNAATWGRLRNNAFNIVSCITECQNVQKVSKHRLYSSWFTPSATTSAFLLRISECLQRKRDPYTFVSCCRSACAIILLWGRSSSWWQNPTQTAALYLEKAANHDA